MIRLKFKVLRKNGEVNHVTTELQECGWNDAGEWYDQNHGYVGTIKYNISSTYRDAVSINIVKIEVTDE